MSDKKALETFNQVISEGDEWLREYGVVSEVSHNTIVTNVYIMFPKVKYVDYLIDTREKIIDMYVYAGFWRLLWWTLRGKSESIVEEIFYLTTGYLKDYEVRVNLKRFKGKDAANAHLEALMPKKDENSVDTESQD